MSHQHLSTQAAFPSSCGSVTLLRGGGGGGGTPQSGAWEMEVRPQVCTCHGAAVVFLLAPFHRGREAQADVATPLIAAPKVIRAAKAHK